MHWWSGDISAHEGIETNMRTTLSQSNNFSLYTVFVFCGFVLSRKTKQQLTSQAESALSSMSAICSLSTMKCVYLGFFIVKTSLSFLNVLTYYSNKGSKQCDCGPFPHQDININMSYLLSRVIMSSEALSEEGARASSDLTHPSIFKQFRTSRSFLL